MSDRDMAYYDFIVDFEIATEDEIQLVRQVLSGYWSEILDAIVYARTGYRSWEQLMEYEFKDYYEDYAEWLED